MNERHFDRLAKEFLADGPTVLADWVYDAAFADVHGARQQPRAGRRPWARALMPLVPVVATAVVLIAVLATVRQPTVGPGLTTGSESRIGGVWANSTDVVLTWEPRAGDPPATYLSAVVYDEFRGQSWSVGDDATVIERAPGEPLLPDTAGLAGSGTRREASLTVTPARSQSVVLVADQPLGIDRAVQVEVVGEAGFFTRVVRAATRDAYSVTALVPALAEDGGPTQARLRAAGTDYPAGLLERYGRAALPPDAVTTPEARALLDEIVRLGGDDPYDLAATTERLLRDPDRFTYDADVRDLACEGLSVVDCFARFKRGFCQYYASTMAVLLRELGVPTRLVEGYLAGEQDPVSGRWTVTARDAHAWVQVFFPGYGWIDFDPTGGGVARIAPLP
jgi:transglutaminase-like putative cysteine protease